MKHTQLFFFALHCLFLAFQPFSLFHHFNSIYISMAFYIWWWWWWWWWNSRFFLFVLFFFSHCKTDFISFLSALITGLLDKKDTIKMMMIIISMMMMMMIMMCNSFDSFHSRNFFFFRAISCHSAMNEWMNGHFWSKKKFFFFLFFCLNLARNLDSSIQPDDNIWTFYICSEESH